MRPISFGVRLSSLAFHGGPRDLGLLASIRPVGSCARRYGDSDWCSSPADIYSLTLVAKLFAIQDQSSIFVRRGSKSSSSGRAEAHYLVSATLHDQVPLRL